MTATPDTKMIRLKILLLGASNCGKTTFLKAVTTSDSLTQYEPTCGCTFHNYNSKMLWPAADLFVHLVDTSDVVSQSPDYLQALASNANMAIVFFDCSNRESIAKAQNIINAVKSIADVNGLRIPM